jgi:hypothetical protein
MSRWIKHFEPITAAIRAGRDGPKTQRDVPQDHEKQMKNKRFFPVKPGGKGKMRCYTPAH